MEGSLRSGCQGHPAHDGWKHKEARDACTQPDDATEKVVASKGAKEVDDFANGVLKRAGNGATAGSLWSWPFKEQDKESKQPNEAAVRAERD